MQEESKSGQRWVKCIVRRGLFASERAVVIELPSGKVSAMVDVSDVRMSGDLPDGEPVEGFVRVRIVESKGGSYLVDLPQPMFGRGSRLLVPATMFG